jgi:hypothetical protein
MRYQNHSLVNGVRQLATARVWRATVLGLICATANAAAVPTRSSAAGPDAEGKGWDEAAPPPSASVNAQEQTDADQLVEQTVELMRAAQGRLESNQLDDETGRVQRQISEHLARLLNLASQRAARSPQVMPDEQPSAPPATSSSATGGTGDQSHQPSQASESSEQPRAGDALAQDEVRRRKDLATAVWGHLPSRLRDRMHGAFSERFLPQYDDLVRRYYEALATQGDGEP